VPVIAKTIEIGLLCASLTLLFEFVFGHFTAGKVWKKIIIVFNLKKGDLFILVLLASALLLLVTGS